MMIEKNKKAITKRLEGMYELNFTQDEIDVYLMEVKEAIRSNKYRIEKNAHRQDNLDLFFDYVIDETMAKDILLGLTSTDFSEVRRNTNKGYEHELLYVFGKDVELVERTGNKCKIVSLYIKFNKLDNCYVIIVSFHEQKYPIKYYFK